MSGPNDVNVVGNHPLSRFHAYPRLPFEDKNTTSLEQQFWYIFLIQHNHPNRAEELLANEDLMWNPSLIASWVSTLNINPNARFTRRTADIFNALVQYQMGQETSPYRQAFLDIIGKFQNPDDVRFVVFSSTGEKVLSCGLKIRERGRPFLGLNLFGKFLSRILRKHLQGQNFNLTRVLGMITDNTYFLPQQRSVLIISDSQHRYFESISGGGDVVAVSGGKYFDMWNVIEHGNYDLAQFTYIILYCGTNVAPRHLYPESQRGIEWRQLKSRLLDEFTRAREPGSILFSCAFDHPRVYGNSHHARAVADELATTSLTCINWRDSGNPFILDNGRIKPQLFHPDGLHLNPDGAAVLWDRFCDFLPGLGFFKVKISTSAQSVSRDMFAPDKSMSRKRKIFL